MDERTVARFWAKVDRRGPDECWPWMAAKAAGYGRFNLDTEAGRKIKGAHQVAYLIAVGPVEPGLDLDHACHNADLTCPGGRTCPHRCCVNPAHLNPATRRENMRRSPRKGSKTHCTEGHEYDAINTYVTTLGHRQCRACNQRRDSERTERRRLSGERRKAA